MTTGTTTHQHLPLLISIGLGQNYVERFLSPTETPTSYRYVLELRKGRCLQQLSPIPVFSFHDRILLRLLKIISCRQRPGPMRCLFIIISAPNRTGRHHITHVILEPRRRSLEILPYSTMAAVESTSVISALVHDCCEHFVLFGGWCDFFVHHCLESSSTSQLLVLSSLQNTGFFREVGAFDM